jgi:hypothetical protein
MNNGLPNFSAHLPCLTVVLAFVRSRKKKDAQILLNAPVESGDRSSKPLIAVPLF